MPLIQIAMRKQNHFIFNLHVLDEQSDILYPNIKVTSNYSAGGTEGGVDRGMPIPFLSYGARCG